LHFSRQDYHILNCSSYFWTKPLLRMRAVLNAVIALAASPNGMAVSDLAAKVRELLGLNPQDYKPRHAAYDLKKIVWQAMGSTHRKISSLPAYF